MKLVDVDRKTYVAYGAQSRAQGISSIHWVAYGESVCVCRVNGKVEVWNVAGNGESLELLHTLEIGEGDSGSSVRALGCGGVDSQTPATSLFYTEAGQVTVRTTDASSSGAGSFQVRGPVESVAASTTRAVFGGKENDLELWDLERGESVWTAKNVPHDEVRLRVPVWIAGVDFFGADADGNSDVIVTGTGHCHIRLYDVRVQRQPVVTFNTENEFRVTRVSAASDGQRLFVSDTVGGLQAWDVRKQRLVRSVRGFAGSIRDLQQSADGDVLVAGGLDRYIRVVDTTTGHIINSVYIKNRVNACCVWSARGGKGKKRGDGDGDDDDDDDEGDEESDDDSEASDRLQTLEISDSEEDSDVDSEAEDVD